VQLLFSIDKYTSTSSANILDFMSYAILATWLSRQEILKMPCTTPLSK